MTAIWADDGSGWRLLPKVGFPDEATLHALVEQTPQLLPLSGVPQMSVVGREVHLGSGYADLLAIESTGRLVIIEIKLASNADARRAVVAQVLSYAAALRGMELETLEQETLGTSLRALGYSGLADAVRSADQEGSFDLESFEAELRDSLASGRFRLVLVLDEAPADLVRLVGYLESIGDKLVVDLIVVSAHEVAGAKVMVPQRIEPERWTSEQQGAPAPRRTGGFTVEGPGDFIDAIANVPEQNREPMQQLADWASKLESDGLVTLATFHGARGILTLLPRLRDERVGLVTIYNDNGAPYLQFWRTVFERRAPEALKTVEQVITPTPVGQGNTLRTVTPEVLDAVESAYQEAVASPPVATSGPFDWSPLHEALDAVPRGRWTTYGDLAQVARTAALAVGQHVQNCGLCTNAYRVLGADGKPRQGFHWTDSEDKRTQQEALAADGVRFQSNGSADPSARLSSSDLAKLVKQ